MTHVADWEDLDAPPPGPPLSVTVAPLIPTNQPAPPTHGVAPDEPVPVARETWVPLQEWTKAKGLPNPTRLNSAPQPAYVLKSTSGALVLTAGTRSAHWDGLELRLGFAPQFINGQLYAHSLDIRKTVQPLLLANTSPQLLTGAVVVIDPGHGGGDSGTRSVAGNRYEKDFTLDWATRLQALMSAQGCQVFLTRSNDTDVALSNRVVFAASHHADVFLSLHFNSAGQDSGEAGLETYCLTPRGMPSSLTRGYADEISMTFPNNGFDAQNLRLAMAVHRSLLQVNGHVDRGVRRARFPAVLRGQERPAILIEGGYLSNPREAGMIAQPTYRQHLAEAVARALLPSADLAGNKPQAREPETGGHEAQLKQQRPQEEPNSKTNEPAGSSDVESP
ncbi:MAG TPA: N-acetylmuramoyl-L-alanine amidase [Candidatus Limnocylindrales bacterium]|nr:N-acetylmuramoyl-L-alanine amidase [Candidatus Limnocylindrales bacterium]